MFQIFWQKNCACCDWMATHAMHSSPFLSLVRFFVWLSLHCFSKFTHFVALWKSWKWYTFIDFECVLSMNIKEICLLRIMELNFWWVVKQRKKAAFPAPLTCMVAYFCFCAEVYYWQLCEHWVSSSSLQEVTCIIKSIAWTLVRIFKKLKWSISPRTPKATVFLRV